MNARFGNLIFLALVLAGPAHAEVVGEVIAAQMYFSSNTALFSAVNGEQYTEVTCGMDFSHGGSPRYFLYSVPTGYVLPDGYEGSYLVTADEDCMDPVVITNALDTRFSTNPRWSQDDMQIAVFGERWDLATGELAERGVFVMDVVYDVAGRPVATENQRLIIPLPGEAQFDWSRDGTWLVYHDLVPDGSDGDQMDLFVFDLITESSTNVTNSPDVDELLPVFSPVDDRIAYTRLVQVRGSYRWDIFTIDLVSGDVVRITSKKTTGSSANRSPQFSPDGQYLSFSSGSIAGPIQPFDIYRIKANGSGKAVNLTGRLNGDFRYHVWRR